MKNNKNRNHKKYQEGIPVNTEIPAFIFPDVFIPKYKQGEKVTKDFINIIQGQFK